MQLRPEEHQATQGPRQGQRPHPEGPGVQEVSPESSKVAAECPPSEREEEGEARGGHWTEVAGETGPVMVPQKMKLLIVHS